jgi:N-acetylmuramoyl-L-alanine amidase
MVLSVVLGGVALAGCARTTPFEASESVLLTPSDTINMYSLASRLGMIVSDYSSTMVAMRDDRNSVVLFSGPEGRAYVNGQAVPAPTGGVVRADGMLFIPVSYEPAIRAQMRGPVARPAAAAPFPTPRPTAPPVAGRVGGLVLIDPGHGGQDPGAISVRRDQEKTIVLDVALVVAERLARSGVDVRMTRQDDRFIELDDRTAMTNRLRPNLFVSLHADYARNRAATGFTVYVSRLTSRPSQAAADAIARRLQAAGVPYRGRKEANYRVLVGTSFPAVLVELGYLSNPREAAYLASPAYRQQLGQAVAEGIVDYLQGF